MATRTIVFKVPSDLFDQLKQKLLDDRTTLKFWGNDAVSHYVKVTKPKPKKS